MNLAKLFFPFSFLLLVFSCQIFSQDLNAGTREPIVIYGGLLHQHQDFYHKAFSLTGLEACAIVNHQLFLGVYGSTFVSNLKVENAGSFQYVHLWEAGLTFGTSMNDSNFFHPGFILNAGYVSLSQDQEDFSMVRNADPEIRMAGMVLAPQIYGELNITKWLRFRTGLSYGVYAFDDQGLIKETDLQNVAFDFGFIFGAFSKSKSLL